MARLTTDEHLALLEHALSNIENEYTPTCKSAGYGSGCPGTVSTDLDFWRRAVDCLPALIAAEKSRRSHDRELARLVKENRDALSWLTTMLGKRAGFGYHELSERAGSTVTAILDLLDRIGEANE